MKENIKRLDAINSEKLVETAPKSQVLTTVETNEGNILQYKDEPDIIMSGDDYKLKNLLKLGIHLNPTYLSSADSRVEIAQRIDNQAKQLLESIDKVNITNQENN